MSIAFDSSNDSSFIAGLRDGVFQLLWECPLPSPDIDLANAAEEAAAKANIMADDIQGVLLTGRPVKGIPPCSLMTYLSYFSHVCQLPVISVFSGRGQFLSSLDEFSVKLSTGGHVSAVMVSGQLTAEEEPCFLESTTALRHLAYAAPQSLFCGATVNPAQYHHQDIIRIYEKMLLKLANGARYLLLPVLWDMKKFQELQWFLRFHDKSIPVLAEMEIYSAEAVSHFRTQPPENTTISENLLRQMLNELQESPEVLRQNQLRRIAMQAVGYRRMGSSGIVIRGIDQPQEMRELKIQIAEMNDRYSTYESWRQAWLADYNDLETPSPYPGEYLYRGLLTETAYPDLPTYTCNHVPDRPRNIVTAVAHFLRKLADGRYGVAPIARLVAFMGHMTPDYLADIRRTDYQSNRACPKRLIEGACGGLHDNGQCECRGRSCFFCHIQLKKQDLNP